jgi:hypothetical protein
MDNALYLMESGSVDIKFLIFFPSVFGDVSLHILLYRYVQAGFKQKPSCSLSHEYLLLTGKKHVGPTCMQSIDKKTEMPD